MMKQRLRNIVPCEIVVNMKLHCNKIANKSAQLSEIFVYSAERLSNISQFNLLYSLLKSLIKALYIYMKYIMWDVLCVHTCIYYIPLLFHLLFLNLPGSCLVILEIMKMFKVNLLF